MHSEKTAALVSEYIDGKLEYYNPGHKTARETGEIIPWYSVDAKHATEYLPFQEKILGLGVTSGAGIPLFGIGNEVAFVHIANFQDTGPVDVTSPEIQTIRIMAYRMHELIRNMLKEPIDIPQLSPREVEVLKWVMKGKSDSVIADILEISEHTVGTYIKRCYHKLGVSSRPTAAARALSLGIITP